MTCIIGFKQGKEVYVAGDSMASNMATKGTITAEKVFRNGEYVIGSAGSVRWHQVLQYKFVAPAIPRGTKDVLSFMVKNFIPTLQIALAESGAIGEEGKKLMGGSAIVAVRGRVFLLQEDFSFVEQKSGYCSVGSGATKAEAAMALLTDEFSDMAKKSPEQYLKKVLKAVSKHDPFVGAPFHVIKL